MPHAPPLSTLTEDFEIARDLGSAAACQVPSRARGAYWKLFDRYCIQVNVRARIQVHIGLLGSWYRCSHKVDSGGLKLVIYSQTSGVIELTDDATCHSLSIHINQAGHQTRIFDCACGLSGSDVTSEILKTLVRTNTQSG
jgi:hypothetical protein